MATSVQVRGALTRALTAWSLASVGLGAALLVARRDARTTGFGRQSLVWGAVDLAIAGLSLRSAGPPVPDEAAAARSLRRLLLLNAVLDVGYVATGALLWRAGRVRRRDSVGDGAGVVVQGAFLLVLDSVCAARLRPAAQGRGYRGGRGRP